MEQLRNHQMSSYHAFSMAQGESLLAQARGAITVDEQVDSQRRLAAERRREEEAQYRKQLLPMVDTVIVCGRQELAFRGHRDDGPLDLSEERSESQTGKESNFKALLRYRAIGDEQLRESITNAPKNRLLTSWRVQNELIVTCGLAIQQDIVAKVREAGVFSVIADETTDKGVRGQLAINLRYADGKGNVREDMVSLLNPKETTGSALADAILGSIRDIGLSAEQLRGQGYDGGSNMSGRFKGVQSRILQIQPLAIYTHCASHRLNLVLIKACSVAVIRNMLGVVSEASDFISGSGPRLKLLEEKVEEVVPESRRKRVKALCRTRWVKQHDSLLVLDQLLPAIVSALEKIQMVGSSEASTKATLLLGAICRFDFLISLQMAVLLFGITIKLSVALQSPSRSLCESMKLVKTTAAAVADSREEFGSVYRKASTIASTLHVTISTPRTSGRQMHRANAGSSDNAEDYYRINGWNVVVDETLAELQRRFPQDHPALKLE